MAQQPQAGIEVETKFIFLAIILYLFPTRVVIDGYDPGRVSWGKHFYPVAPGRHHVQVYFPYLFLRTAGKAELVVDVTPGQMIHVQYKAPWLVFLSGKMSAVAASPLGAVGYAPLAPGYAPGGPAPGIAGAVATLPAAAEAAGQVASTPAAGWYPDPHGRHEQRYWDGERWTEHVSSGGNQATDPV